MDLNNMKKGGLGDLKNFETDFNENAVWERIESKQKKRPVLWFWMSGVIAMTMVIGGVYLLFFENDSMEKVHNYPTVENLTSNKQKPNREIAGEQIIEQSIFDKKVEPIFEKVEKENSTPTVVETNINDSKISPKETSQNKIFETSNSSTQPIVQEHKIILIEKESHENRQESIVEPIVSLSPNTLVYEISEQFDFGLEKLSKTPISKRKGKPFLLSAYSGVGYQFRHLNSKSDLNNQDYINLRKTNETVLESISFGFEIDRKLSKKWFVGTGIEMVFHSERLRLSEYQMGHSDNLAPEDIPSELAGQSGFLIKQTIDDFYNQYRLLNAPLKLGYLIRFKKIRLMPEIGLVFNISQNAKGDIQNEEKEIMNLSPYYKTNIGIGYRGGCKILAPIRNGFMIYARPSFDFNPQNIATDENPLIQKRSAVRLDLGLSRSF